MGVYMNVRQLEGNKFEAVNTKFTSQLGFEDVKINAGFSKALAQWKSDCFVVIEPKDLDKAIENILKLDTVVYPKGCYYAGDYKGLSIEEKSMFIQIATICKVKGWYIVGC